MVLAAVLAVAVVVVLAAAVATVKAAEEMKEVVTRIPTIL
jgi:FlaG/FlaF family flagellin (archaellin)